MDGGWWICYCFADCHLFVNAIHGEIDHAGTFAKWGQFAPGSGFENRTKA